MCENQPVCRLFVRRASASSGISDIGRGNDGVNAVIIFIAVMLLPLCASRWVWQRSRGAACVFACVCVEGEYVAKEFARLYLHTATNCVVEVPTSRRCLPSSAVRALSLSITGTSFPQKRETAGLWRVASATWMPNLAMLLGGDSLPVGTAVELTGLSNDAFNGRRGIVTETPAEVRQAGRVAVVVDGQAIALKRENLVVDAPTRPASPDGDLKKIGHAAMDAEHAAIGQALAELRETAVAGRVANCARRVREARHA